MSQETHGPEPGVTEDRGNENKCSPAARLVELVLERAKVLFHTPESEPFATVSVSNHWETLGLEEKVFRVWAAALYYETQHTVPTRNALSEAISVLAGKALYEGPEYPVHVRVAEHDGAIYLDLANKAWEAVKITRDGWEIVSYPPVKFRRARGMKSLPKPMRGGSIDELRPFVNVGSNEDWVSLVGFLIGALRPQGPYPILVVEGPQGSAKSTATGLVRALIDPNSCPLRGVPADCRDLMISATNSWCQVFENLSKVPQWLSDALCRLSTGGGLATRGLYTNRDEALFEATRPLVLNGIDTQITRGDLLDRCLFIALPGITDDKRKAEKELWKDFEKARPRILGALLDALVCALRRLPEVNLPRLPRMADCAAWVTASEPALGWEDGTFLRAYEQNRSNSNILALEASPLFPAIQELVEAGPWQGTATDLLQTLAGDSMGEYRCRQKDWPKDPRSLSAALRRLAPSLKIVGLDVQLKQTPGRNSQKLISIAKVG